MNEYSQHDDVRVYSVSQINNEIKNILQATYPLVCISGEISNFKLYSSGHMYFNLKDESSQIRAVMFRYENNALTFSPEDGMQVLVFGHLDVYSKRGDYQIIVNEMRQNGAGRLAEEFEKLKKKLLEEGLFDESAKKAIPEIITKIGVVTSKDGAALHDILEVLKNLGSQARVLIYPVRVQGEEAEYEICEAIKYLNKNYKELDVLLVGRGGGCAEDLQAFNTESVARAIYNSQIPVISCVGHEVDFTIADFTADLRAATPSAAAEITTRGFTDFKRRFKNVREALYENLNNILENARSALSRFEKARAFRRPHLIYEDKITYIDDLRERLANAVKRALSAKNERVNDIMHKLDLLSPLSVLKRGYAVCKNEDGKIVKSSSFLKPNENISVKFAKGSIKAKVFGADNND